MGAAVVVDIPKRQVIRPTGEKLGWLKARESIQAKGGLPSNVLHDDVLVRSEDWNGLRGYYPGWAKEVLVYPAKGGQFKKEEDVVDTYQDDAGRTWVFPASSMPEEAVGRDNIGLFVDPESVEVNDHRVVVLAKPHLVVLLGSFIQANGGMGLLDEITRVPFEVASEVALRLTDDQKRWLYRINGAGVRPLVRGVIRFYDRRGVIAKERHDGRFGVAYVGLEEAAPARVQLERDPKDPGVS